MSKDEMKGLNLEQVKKRQEKYGKNELNIEKKKTFFSQVIHTITQPMFMLLIITAIIYFILGEPRDGLIMLVFVVFIIGIDIFQEWKTDKTLNALKDLSAPHIRVIREGKEQTIASSNLVPDDLMIISEGVKIPADGEIIKNYTLCVDESSLTGEAEGVWKVAIDESEKTEDYWKKDYCYAGTLVTQGSAIVKVCKIGVETEYGKIGKNVATAPQDDTPLQKQTSGLVKICAIIAGILFLAVSIITFINISEYNGFQDRIIKSILSGITLAMAMIPEEFPVVLTVFLSMGAWRLAKKSSLVRKLPSVETLGAVSVLCVDKTGTITMNQMEVEKSWLYAEKEEMLVETMGLGCEPDAYDPMERAMLEYCDKKGFSKENLFSKKFIKEYVFSNELKMMGHVWKKDNGAIIALKGSSENILKICNLDDKKTKDIEKEIIKMSEEGLRVIAVARQVVSSKEDIPKEIMDCNAEFCGLVGLVDPPRDTVKEDIKRCTKAGIRVVMITGDNGITAKSIANKVGIPHSGNIITGEELEKMTDEELKEKVKDVSIFSRVIPEHKMRIVKAFRENGEVVAMTGDGVNDAPALKYADIGIAMGKRGSEVSREAADLILMDDNFSTIVDTVKDGRRIYDNIRKAIGYIFTIHIPIAASSLIAPLLNINPSDLLLLPLHIVLMELIIDPTCSIVLERQPAEENIMDRKPRNGKEKLLRKSTLIKSIIQGIIIFLAAFITYFFTLKNTQSAELARTMGIGIIMFANLFLVQVNSSETEFVYKSIRKLAKDKVMWLTIIITTVVFLILVYTPVNNFIKMAPLNIMQLLQVLLTAFICVMWYEVVKIIRRKKKI